MCAPDAARQAELVRATINLGHALKLRVVAEGIENSEILEQLKELGCDLAQGYLIGKPLPAEQLTFEHANTRTRTASADSYRRPRPSLTRQ